MNLSQETTEALVEEGIRINREITELEARLKQINTELLSRKDAKSAETLADPARDGSRILFASAKHTVPLQQTADKLKTALTTEEEINQAKALAGVHFRTFYKEVPASYARRQKDGKAFRSQVRELIPTPTCEELIKLMTLLGKDGSGSSNSFVNWALAKPKTD